ncbi:MAG: cytochrome P450 [Terracidiphilus sp.]|jgi:CRP-like cAMP-binding protein/cytochrome P450
MASAMNQQEAKCPYHPESAEPPLADAPGPPLVKGWPLLGSTFQFLSDTPGVLNRAYRKYGPVFRLRALWIKYTVIGGKEAKLFMEQGLPNRYLSREKIFHTVGMELGTNDFMMSVSGPTHLRLRRLLGLGYSREAASAFVPDFVEVVADEVRKWRPGSVLAVMDTINHIAFEQYSRAMCGHSLRQHFPEAMTTIETNMNVGARVWPFVAFKNPWYRKSRNKIVGLISDMVHEAANQAAVPGSKKTIIDTLLSVRDKEGVPLRHDQVVCYAMYGCAGSVAYMARLIGFMLYQILIDPELKRILTEEADRAFSEGIRDASDVRRMGLMCAVYHETLRFHPVSQGMPYHTDHAFVFQGKKVDAGDITVLSQVPMSFSEQHFTDPMRFDHTRMMSPRNEHRNGGGFHPFGMGDRTCTAMGLTELMAVTMVATILHECDLEMTPAGYRLKLRVLPLPAPDNGFRIKVKPRKVQARETMLSEAAPSEEDINAAFPGYDNPSVAANLETAQSRTFQQGEIIIRQGDTATAFYIVERGTVSVSKDGKVVARLEPGHYFGEIGLLHGVPRTATVVAESPTVQVLELSRERFLDLVENSDLIAGEMAAIARKRTAHNILRNALPGISADALERLFPEFSAESLEPGTTVIHEGDAADRFYVIAEGIAVVTRRADGRSKELARLGPGEYFGEMGMITAQPRNATVRISDEGPAVLLSTDRKGFLAAFHAGASGDLAQTMITRAALLK